MKNLINNPYFRCALILVASLLIFSIPGMAQDGADLLQDALQKTSTAVKERVNQIGYLVMGICFTLGLIVEGVNYVKMIGNDPNAKDAMKTTAIITIVVIVIIYVGTQLAGTALTKAGTGN